MSRREMLLVLGVLAATVAAVAALAAFAASLAQAEPASQYSVRLTGAQPNGAYTVTFGARVFDTTGAVPPRMSEWSLRRRSRSTRGSPT